MQPIILASTSTFRKSILEKLQIPFTTSTPDCDETPHKNETAISLVERLAIDKAKAVSTKHNEALIIGSDQVAVLDNIILGKPHTHENAIKQLKNSSGKTVHFYTGLCLYNSQSNQFQSCVEIFEIEFKQLSHQQIENYLHQEKPYNCCGSFKSEALGITLFKRMKGDDPNTLIGLPLIKLVSMLENENIDVLGMNTK